MNFSTNFRNWFQDSACKLHCQKYYHNFKSVIICLFVFMYYCLLSKNFPADIHKGWFLVLTVKIIQNIILARQIIM